MTSLAGAAGFRKVAGQNLGRSLPVRSLGSISITVSDARRSVEFFQGLFGMPILSRQGSNIRLRIGAGPEYVALREDSTAKPGFEHFGMTVDAMNSNAVQTLLTAHGVRARITKREETEEVYVGDPDGLMIKIQDQRDCGGSGRFGEVCSTTEPSPKEGLILLRDLSHVTLFVTDSGRSTSFYQDVFAMPVQAHQGTSPLLAVGSDRQFLTIVSAPGGRSSASPRGAAINHVSFRMEAFDPDKVLKKLEEAGIHPRGEGRGPVGPMKSYVTMRMPDRGGAPGGTPELYFTDPDGILWQIQDVSYCGGSGTLGEICP